MIYPAPSLKLQILLTNAAIYELYTYMMNKLAVATLLLSCAPVQAQTITNPTAFKAAIAAVSKDQSTRLVDKFAEPIKLPVAGQTFTLTIPATTGNEGGGEVTYDYKDGNLILDVSPRKLWPSLEGPSAGFPTMKVSSSTRDLGEYVGQNGFGASARVRSLSNSGSAIALVSSPKPMLSPMRVAINGSLLDDTDWWISLPLPPAEAKATALDTLGVIEGLYTQLPDGKAGACSFGGVRATIDHPTSYTTETCYIGANVTRIALVRKSTGQVLKEWTPTNAPRLGATLWGNIRVGMNERELKAAYPSIASYGYIEAEGAQVEMLKQVVANVEVRKWPATGKALSELLTQRYGAPLFIKCITKTLCEGKWSVSDGVVAYQGITDSVTFMPADAKPPVGFAPS